MLKRAVNTLGFLALIGAAPFALASGLTAPFAMDSAEVMPVGVRSFRVMGFSADLQDRYDGYGNQVSMGSAFNQNVSIEKLLDSQPKGYSTDELKGGLKSFGVNLNDSAGLTTAGIDTRMTATIPALAYGWTDKLTVGIGVPIIYSNVSVAAGYVASPQLQDAVNRASANGQGPKLQQLKPLLNNIVSTQLADDGYAPLQDQSRTDVGDVNLLAKYQTYKKGDLTTAITGTMILPTGPTPDVNKLIDLSPGDGHLDVGVGTAVDYKLTGRLTATYSISYLYQMPSSKAERIPTSTSDTLTPDIDYNTIAKRGDIIGTGVGLGYQPFRLWSVSTAYTFQYKAPDSYQGSEYAPVRYDYMANDTEQDMQAVMVALQFSTIPLYRAKEFEIPMDIGLSYADVIDGKNIPKFSLVAFQLVSYF